MQLNTTTAVLAIHRFSIRHILILNQSHGWGRGPTQQCVGNRKEYTLDRSAVSNRTHTHTLTPKGDSVSIQPIVHVFLECGSKVSPGLKAPSLKSNPEPSCCPLHEVLWWSLTLQLCHIFLGVTKISKWTKKHKYNSCMCRFCVYSIFFFFF